MTSYLPASNTLPNPAFCGRCAGRLDITHAQNCYSLPILTLISIRTLFSSINKATQSPNSLWVFGYAQHFCFAPAITHLENSLPTNVCLSKSYQYSKVGTNTPSFIKLPESHPATIYLSLTCISLYFVSL